MNEVDFRSYYDAFVETLPLQDRGTYAKLYTDARNSPFKVYQNSQNSIVVKAFTDNASPMVITANQLSKVVFDNERYLYSSYEPILIERIKNNNYIRDDEIEKEMQENLSYQLEGSDILANNSIKNIILYGSPGVGKTYNIQEIISYIEGGLPEKDIFSRISNNEKVSSHNILYKNLVYENRVKFVTFHQSFGYEDFIEGFRPNKKGNIELVDGIFKEICRKEKIKLSPIYTSINTFKTNCHDNTIDVGQIIHEFNDIVTTKSPVKEIRLEEDSFVILFENNLSISITDEELYNCLLDFIDDNFDRDDIRTMAIDLRKNRYIDILARFYIEWIKKIDHFVELKTVCKDIVKTESKSIQKNKYLVIDEINRGNISKIFGELITLIEEDKRDTLEVTLPYSKKTFKIPSNLYIIGTMNSTDKSIALIDIALRRRFTFLKMEPNTDLVENEKAQIIMEQLNEKITETLGADYVLGHSYFMKIENDDDLEFVLEYKIKPLLEEYFYGDSEGLKQILEMIDE